MEYSVDHAVRRFDTSEEASQAGYPVGPLAPMDELTLTLVDLNLNGRLEVGGS